MEGVKRKRRERLTERVRELIETIERKTLRLKRREKLTERVREAVEMIERKMMRKRSGRGKKKRLLEALLKEKDGVRKMRKRKPPAPPTRSATRH